MRKAAVLSTDLRRGRFAAVVGAAGAGVLMRMTAPVTVVTVVVMVLPFGSAPGAHNMELQVPTVGPVTSCMHTPLRRMSARKKAKVRAFPVRWRPQRA